MRPSHHANFPCTLYSERSRRRTDIHSTILPFRLRNGEFGTLQNRFRRALLLSFPSPKFLLARGQRAGGRTKSLIPVPFPAARILPLRNETLLFLQVANAVSLLPSSTRYLVCYYLLSVPQTLSSEFAALPICKKKKNKSRGRSEKASPRCGCCSCSS